MKHMFFPTKRILKKYRKYFLVIENYGTWTQENGLKQLYKNIPLVKRRINFKKSEIVVGVVLQDVKNLQIKNYDDIA